MAKCESCGGPISLEPDNSYYCPQCDDWYHDYDEPHPQKLGTDELNDCPDCLGSLDATGNCPGCEMSL